MTDEIIKEYRRPELEKEDSGKKSRERIKKNITAKLVAIKSTLLKLNKPKFLTLAILLMTSVVVILALNLASSEEKEDTPQAVTQISSPNPSQSTDPSLENIAQRVKTYNNKLDNLEDYQKKLIYPIVDLDIGFD